MIEIDIQKNLNGPEGKLGLEINLIINERSFSTLYGKSGVGKTSLLRMIAGLMTPDAGRIVVSGETWFDSGESINRSPQKRSVGMVFQDYALFPNMTVLENLEYARLKNTPVNTVNHLLELMELGELKNRKPTTLSGGQRQRVALARALVQKPAILLLDEPLSALDNEMRNKLQQYLIDAHKEYELTTLLVSHDVSEILRTSNDLIVLENGKVKKRGTPVELLSGKDAGGKFQFTGEVFSIEKQDFIYIISVLIGNDLVKVVAEESEARVLNIGDKVLVASKAFNPIIKKL